MHYTLRGKITKGFTYQIDKSLSVEGVAADSKATGDAINGVKKTAEDFVNAHGNNKNNPHGVTKEQVGLGNVDNTSDMEKPVSTAQATAIADAKNEANNNANGRVSKSGDVMTGQLTVPAVTVEGTGANSNIYLRSKQRTKMSAEIVYIGSDQHLQITVYDENTGYAEIYSLPTVSAGIKNHVAYNILTTKNPVTIAQGGTGATTREGALKNLNGTSGTPTHMPLCYQYLADTGITSSPVTTQAVLEAMPINSILSFTQHTGRDAYLSDLPIDYGTVILMKGVNMDFTSGWATDIYGVHYRYKYHRTFTTSNGWERELTSVLSTNDYGNAFPANPKTGRIYFLKG